MRGGAEEGRREGWLAAAALLLALTPFGRVAAHEHDGGSDWLFFLSGAVIDHYAVDPAAPDDNDEPLAADVLYTHTRGRLRVLAETELSTHDQEIERLQVGWEFSDTSVLWLGRFHQPASSWNTVLHHGQYLQTSITRPAIENWEDEGGVLAQSITGALFEKRRALGGDRGLSLTLAAGAAPVLVNRELDPVQVSHPNHGGHGWSGSGRLAFLPQLAGDEAIGLVGARHEVHVVGGASAGYSIEQTLLGAYANLDRDNWQLHAALYALELRPRGAAPAGVNVARFNSGYLQLERTLARGWVVYARVEDSSGVDRDSFVPLQAEKFTLRRALGGARWDLARRQALTLEVARATTIAARYSELRLQWSGVLP
jgi:hypothetical protein